jgi:hypothetical protein
MQFYRFVVDIQMSIGSIGYDFNQNSMPLFRNCRFLSEENVPGTKLIFDDWSTFFEKTLNKPSENITK